MVLKIAAELFAEVTIPRCAIFWAELFLFYIKFYLFINLVKMCVWSICQQYECYVYLCF